MQVVLPQPPQAYLDAGLMSDEPGRIGVWNLMGPKDNLFVISNQYGSMGAPEPERRSHRWALCVFCVLFLMCQWVWM